MQPRDKTELRWEFARRLQEYMLKKGWNQTELANRTKKHVPEGHRFERDIVSNYMRGRALPSPVNLRAMCDAIGCEPDDLLPVDLVPASMQPAPKTPRRSFEDMGDGNVWLTVNQAVPFDVALKIMEMLKGETSNDG